MSNNFFDDDEDGFIDNPVSRVDGQWQPDQGHVRAASAPIQNKPSPTMQKVFESKKQPPAPIEAEEFELPEIDDEQEDYSAVLSDARLRLEQGRLYEMVINNDLFEGSGADPIASRFVQNQIRRFAKEQMEIMLGMRKDTSTIEHLEIDFPFNQVEVNVLKKLAFAASKGASENSDRFVPEVKKTTQEVDNVPRREGLNKISLGSSQKSVAKKLPARPTGPIARQKTSAQSSAIKTEDPDADYKPLTKDPSQMSQDELANHWRAAEARQAGKRTVKSAAALPMATYEQTAMLAAEHANTVNSNGGMSKLIELVKNLPSKN